MAVMPIKKYMSEQKRKLSSVEEKSKDEEREEVYDDALGRGRQIESSNTEMKIHQENAIQPVVEENDDNNNNAIAKTSTANNFHLMMQEEEDLTIKVRNAGDALYYLVISIIEKAKTISSQKLKELATRDISPASIAAKKDARDIATLGESVQSLAKTFEDVMTEMRKQPYSEQVHLLTGYKKLLKEQIKVVDSRIKMAKRLIK
jgi:hypothetical protein